MVCAVKFAFSDSVSWKGYEYAPFMGQSLLVFAVVDSGASEPEVYDLPGFVRGEHCFGFDGCGAWYS